MMILFTALSDVLLYISFSILAGWIVLQFIPTDKKPVISPSKPLLLVSIAGIALFSLAPVIELTIFLENGEGWIASFFDVLIHFRTGNGWVLTALFCVIFFLSLYYGSSKFMNAYYLAILILLLGFYSHVSTVNLWGGFLSHTIHFFVMAMWAGVLIHITWFTAKEVNWQEFKAWFTPFAIGCFVVLIGSGIVIMLFFVDLSDYGSSWLLPYGQALLLKHLTIIPLVAAAFINGFLSKKKMERTWLKVESFLLLLVFGITGYMSKLAPPHNINNTFRSEGAAPFVEILKGPQFLPIDSSVSFSLNGVLLIALGLACLVLMVLGYKKALSPWLSLLFGVSFVIAVYIGLMMNISF